MKVRQTLERGTVEKHGVLLKLSRRLIHQHMPVNEIRKLALTNP